MRATANGTRPRTSKRWRRRCARSSRSRSLFGNFTCFLDQLQVAAGVRVGSVFSYAFAAGKTHRRCSPFRSGTCPALPQNFSRAQKDQYKRLTGLERPRKAPSVCRPWLIPPSPAGFRPFSVADYPFLLKCFRGGNRFVTRNNRDTSHLAGAARIRNNRQADQFLLRSKLQRNLLTSRCHVLGVQNQKTITTSVRREFSLATQSTRRASCRR